MVWKKDFGTDAALASICTDPTDARRVCVAGTKGSLNVLKFAQPPGGVLGASATPVFAATNSMPNPPRGEVKLADSQTYQVDVKPGDTLVCKMTATRDLLYVLLPREVSHQPHVS